MNLLVNIDHVATLRNARGEGYPIPSEAAQVCEKAGASGIVFHLRGDRRHIVDSDVEELKNTVKGTLDFEMAATNEMLEILKRTDPDLCTLVPEGREELTTEGGLNMKSVYDDFEQRVFPFIRETKIEISLFVDPNPEDIDLAYKLGSDAVELHTGTFANAETKADQLAELKRLRKAAIQANDMGMKVNAGHGLNLENLPLLLDVVPYLNDISIGHALVGKALFWGFPKTVKAYIELLSLYEDVK